MQQTCFFADSLLVVILLAVQRPAPATTLQAVLDRIVCQLVSTCSALLRRSAAPETTNFSSSYIDSTKFPPATNKLARCFMYL